MVEQILAQFFSHVFHLAYVDYKKIVTANGNKRCYFRVARFKLKLLATALIIIRSLKIN